MNKQRKKERKKERKEEKKERIFKKYKITLWISFGHFFWGKRIHNLCKQNNKLVSLKIIQM